MYKIIGKNIIMFSSEKLKVPRQECEPILSTALSDIYDNKKRLPVAWSKCDNWQDILDYEENIKNAINRQIGYTSRLWWE